MSHDGILRQAENLLPLAVPEWQQNLTKPTQLYIAVRLPHRPFTIDETADSDNYLWFRGHANLSIEKIQKIVCEKCETHDIVLRSTSSSAVLGNDLRVSHLNAHNRLLVLFAAMSDDNGSKSSSAFNTAPSSPRPPLMPVNRQISAQPAQSPADSKLASSPKSTMTPPTTIDSQISAVKPEHGASPGMTQHRSASTSTPLRNQMTPDMPSREPYRRTFPNLKAEPKAENQGAVDSDLKPSEPGNDLPPKDEGKQPLMLEETESYVPRDQGNPFAASQEEEGPPLEEAIRGIPLRELTEEQIPERLEAGVAVGLELLSQIEKPLKELGNEDAQNWLQQIEKVKSEAVKSRTVVGVVGNTGAGKSSVINAMLDEERLVPTNCMRACTAVVTEMSYNDSTNPKSLYRAEIEFIQPEDWEKELHVLFTELFDESGNISREVSNPDSEAGVAYAKIRAVYHKHTREMLKESSPERLMRVGHVQKVLGSTRRISERDSSVFYKRLQQYVDSKEKGQEKKDKNGKVIGERKRDFEMWPLIKVVKIFTKAEALSTGAVIVDLPGVHDSNAARAAVAAGYMKQCTGLWIVAPINRAVDDKAAKTLLGDTFKRQLKFDGTYSAVTFICSKTDDISVTEAQDSLDLGDQMENLEEKSVDIESRRRNLLKQLKEAKASKKDHEETMEQVDEQIEKWEGLEEERESGKVVYAPVEKKRKRVKSSTSAPKKRRRRSADSDDSDDDFQDESESEAEEVNEQPQGEPLTEDQISKKLAEMREIKKEARREKKNLDERIKEFREELSKVDKESDAVEIAKTAICIQGRNGYSRTAIQQDFAAGIRELDQENAAEEDPDNFNPAEDIRDYEEVARTLPVFCVSSRAYQKLSGRLQKDNDVPGFLDAEQTEIPQLQHHCKKLTIKGRQASCRRFLNNLNSLATSLGLWASDDGSGIKMTLQQRDAEKSFLTRKLKELEKALEKTVSNTLEDACETLDDELFSKFQPATQAAADSAVPTATGWGAHRNDGGLYWSTYKATVRRNGVWRNNFNDELAEPIYKTLATAWEKAFQRRMPSILKAFQKSAHDVLKKFHTAVEQRMREKGIGLPRVMLLGTKLDSYKAIFGDLAGGAIEALNNGQRELNREFTPVIAHAMESCYEWCAAEKGAGQYARMKAAMSSHVDRVKDEMFRDASDQVKDGLSRLCEQIKTTMLDKADGICVQLKRDYGGVVGLHASQEMKMTREERAARRSVDEIIGAADARFQGVLSTALDELKKEVDASTEEVDENMEVEDDGFDDFQDNEDDGNESERSEGAESAAGSFVVPDEEGL